MSKKEMALNADVTNAIVKATCHDGDGALLWDAVAQCEQKLVEYYDGVLRKTRPVQLDCLDLRDIAVRGVASAKERANVMRRGEK